MLFQLRGMDINKLQQQLAASPLGKALPLVSHFSGQPATSAVLIKKGGDYPAFWQRDQSFIEVMEMLYPRIVDKNKASL